MHGHFNTSPEQAFTDYTKIRYTYFDQFKEESIQQDPIHPKKQVIVILIQLILLWVIIIKRMSK